MKFTVGIITYGRPKYIEDLLVSLENQTMRPDEIIIVDDSEDSKTAEVVSDYSRKTEIPVNYIQNPEKSIQGKARNQIVSEAEGDVICFLDDDTYCKEKWLESIKQAYQINENVIGVGGPALDADQNLNLTYNIDRSDKSQCRINDYGEIFDRSDVWVPPEVKEVDLFRGANMSFRKQVLEEISGFDSNYKGNGYREETDVMVRMGNKGKLLYHPEARVYHIQSKTGGARMYGRKLYYWKGKNHIQFLKKNFPEKYQESILRLLFRTEGGPSPLWKTLVRVLRFRNLSELAIIKGYIDGIRGV